MATAAEHSSPGTGWRGRARRRSWWTCRPKRLVLEQRRGSLISRTRATAKAFSFARMLRDRWQAWPARVGPLLAAQFDLDAGVMTVVLEGYVREHLEELASERVDF